MDAEEIRWPSRPTGEAPLLPSPYPPDDKCQDADESPPFPVSPPPIPWPRVFPSL